MTAAAFTFTTTGTAFAIVWFLIAAVLFFVAFTEDTFFFFVAPFFVILGLWAFINSRIKTDLMAGPFLWIYRGLAVILLIICVVKYIIYKKNT